MTLVCEARDPFGFLMVYKGLKAQLVEIKAALGWETFQIATTSLADRTVLAAGDNCDFGGGGGGVANCLHMHYAPSPYIQSPAIFRGFITDSYKNLMSNKLVDVSNDHDKGIPTKLP
ncbi:hypothetical protein BTVI_101759 [Pitangus sulphuratus]|nr:hypothetical protein BTVI_101759 [Pitangus sulphuratus]